MIKEFNNLKEIEKYYDENTNTYIFRENNLCIDLVIFNFDLDVKANIKAQDIKASDINTYDIKANDIDALDIKAKDIYAKGIYAWNICAKNINANNIIARDINANNINAENINYYAVCVAYKNIKCKSIKGRRENSKHFVLDGKIEVEENDKY